MAQTRSSQPYERTAHDAADGPVLIAYASRGGSTRAVAERIAQQLEERGRAAVVEAAGDIADLSAYHAVVLGSAIYDGRWLPEADELAQRNRGSLANRPVWLFSVGALSDRQFGSVLRRPPKALPRLRDAIRPRGIRTFAGVVDGAQPRGGAGRWRGCSAAARATTATGTRSTRGAPRSPPPCAHAEPAGRRPRRSDGWPRWRVTRSI